MRSLILLLTAFVVVALYALNHQFGNLNQDEGWYLYAAQSVARGELPYRDFAYTQAPLLPYVYALASPAIDALGIRGGRLVTAGFGLLSIVFAALFACRLATSQREGTCVNAIVLTLALVGLNTFQSYYFTIVKTYALCAFLFLAGYLALSAIRSGKAWPALFAGFLLALAAGTRLSAGLALPIMGLALLLARRRIGDAPWFIYGIGGLAGLALAFLPSFLLAPEGLQFGLLEYHIGRTAENPWVLKGGFISRLVQDYYLAFALLAILVVARVSGLKPPARLITPSRAEALAAAQPTRATSHIIAGAWITLAATTLLHISTAFPYDDYQAFLYPLFGALLVVHLVRWLPAESPRPRNALLVGFFLLGCASAFSSPINQDWFIQGRDRVWWKSKEKPDLVTLQQAANTTRELAGAETAEDLPPELLTQDTYLAVEAGLRLPHGLQMGPFAYYPEMSDERAKKLHLLNRAGLTNLIATTDAPVAAFSGYGLTIQCPEVSELPDDHQADLRATLLHHFDALPDQTIPHFGQGFTPLEFFTRRNDDRP